MKWIKTFEELKPDIYRRAGKKLVSIGHAERGGRLVDYSREKETGLYNMFLCKARSFGIGDSGSEAQKDKTYSFSFSKYEVVYGYSSGLLEGMDLEDILQQWKKGDKELDIDIIFYFRPTSVTIKSMGLDENLDKDYPLFSLKYTLAIYDDGEHDSSKDLAELYELNEWLSLRTYFTDDVLYGIFSDKKSASLFTKTILPGAIDLAKEKLTDLYSAIGTSTEYYERCIDGFKYITSNHLYRSKLKDSLGNQLGGGKLVDAMYCTILENIHER